MSVKVENVEEKYFMIFSGTASARENKQEKLQQRNLVDCVLRLSHPLTSPHRLAISVGMFSFVAAI